ncbi:uncharacterized protein LOC111278644 [Durio zibethinus]|uniref:Uncharacterized protein LOC111278644 n=1 Tax=Durio zibethinus TaxID=66656 RepID=A0A6P5WZQ8_DURZI|nr:uncharacterized protein LOC111278644 [Durio zibethinus]
MAGIATRISWNHRNLRYGCQEFKFPEQPDSSLSDMEFEFLEDYGDQGFHVSCNTDEFRGNEMVDGGGELGDDEEEEEKENDGSRVENNKSYWESQHQVLQDTLCRTSSLESRIRNATKEALKDFQGAETICACGKSIAESCRNCLMRELSSRLQNAGFNSAICKSKWRSSPDIPSGEHTFLDVIENSRKGDVRVIVELNFRAEFEMARASENYNRLVQRLPEVFVGKVERLSNVIKILCMAAKKCMKEKKMHMGPWRKHRYMQAKWLKSCERNTSKQSLSMGYSGRLSKPKASMLTVDLLEKLSNVHCTAVEVV